MKTGWLLLTLSVLVTAFCRLTTSYSPLSEQTNPIAVCGASTQGPINRMTAGKFTVALPGWGNYSYKISTQVDSAQFYFDQGLTMYYSYHMKEAMASFKEAARLDPNCPMAWWGQALAGGPYYNAAHLYTVPPDMAAVLVRMNELATHANPKEKRLIQVMNTRYSADLSNADRQQLNQAYASATRQLITEFDDPNITMLYVDAVMLLHAWDFWTPEGKSKAWTQEVVELTQNVLKNHPHHPAALHYLIHLTEASNQPEVALANAGQLESQFPGVAHMVHMASHEYQRNGLFSQGVIVNDQADENLIRYDSLVAHLGLVKHSPHYFAVQTYCALTGGMYKTGLRDALRCRRSVSPTPQNPYDQYLYMLPSLTLVRLGKWDEVLATEKPNPAWAYANLLDHFARGMALVSKGQLDEAKKEREGLRSLLNEPSDWPLPARQYLGAYLLNMRKAAEAEAVYRQDLVENPGNGWSLIGLHQALTSQGKKTELPPLEAKYRSAFSMAEQLPTSSIF